MAVPRRERSLSDGGPSATHLGAHPFAYDTRHETPNPALASAATHQALREALLGSPPEDGLQGGGGRGLEDTDELIRESDLAFEVPPPFRIPLSPGNRACRAVT